MQGRDADRFADLTDLISEIHRYESAVHWAKDGKVHTLSLHKPNQEHHKSYHMGVTLSTDTQTEALIGQIHFGQLTDCCPWIAFLPLIGRRHVRYR